MTPAYTPLWRMFFRSEPVKVVWIDIAMPVIGPVSACHCTRDRMTMGHTC